MGIKDLWTILEPYSERKPLHNLGKVVGIDLSGWICENQNVVDFFVQPKMYLRNLFFRTAYLLMAGVTPIFVLDGEAPTLKHKVIAQRNEIQFRGARPRENARPKDPNKGRTRFKYVLQQCRDLLQSMGCQCLQASGEAEAFLAHLNREGLIDGIISQDSDCFGYGAVVVYRNFSVSKQGKQASQGGSVDVYDMRRVWETLDLRQGKMITLALLCGCDYAPDGVEGVGRDSVMKLFKQYKDEEIIQRMRDWRLQADRYTAQELKVDDKGVCANCGHRGATAKHTRSGCSECRTAKGCDESLWRDRRLALKAEMQIRRKALVDPAFPSEEIIVEFLQRVEIPSALELDWKQPNIIRFVKNLSTAIQWTEIYTFQKIFPLMTRWQMQHAQEKSAVVVIPKKIRKKRTLKGVESLEIQWSDEGFEGLFSKDEIDAFELENPEEGLDSIWVTIEPKTLVEEAYPDLVEQFLGAKAKKKRPAAKSPRKTKKPKKKLNSSLNDMGGLLDAIEAVERKTKRKAPLKGQQKITKFVQPKVTVPVDFSDENDENESFSAVIATITSQKSMPSEFKGHPLVYKQIHDSPIRLASLDDSLVNVKPKSAVKQLSNESFDDFFINLDRERCLFDERHGKTSEMENDVSFFFDRVDVENDAFEQSFGYC